MRIEDWFLLGLFGALVLTYLVVRALLVLAQYQLMKTQLESAISNVRIGYSVTRRFTKIIADLEMTGKTQTVVISPELADAMYKAEAHLKETLDLLQPNRP